MMEMIRYCDDFVVCCESAKDAENFTKELEQRMAKFELSISKEKTSIVRFGRNAWNSYQKGGKRVETFNFLGFYPLLHQESQRQVYHGTQDPEGETGQRTQRAKSLVKENQEYAPSARVVEGAEEETDWALQLLWD